MGNVESLHLIAARYGLDAIYGFGSRAAEVSSFVREGRRLDSASESDVDIGVLPRPDRDLDVHARVRLAGEIEELLGVSRVDLAHFERERRAQLLGTQRR